ncbi:hypothetical protein [Absidia glauca]|uniref:PIPK domain-containing protein n=1 Tax=Absidia glauca TaxID=4829 RepID=A0A163J9P8_ABSGL|nr:hypothetical protein [Absidia glauca]
MAPGTKVKTPPQHQMNLIKQVLDHHYPVTICPVCNLEDSSRARIETHYRQKHKGEPGYHCLDPACGQSFTSRPGLQYHSQASHTVKLENDMLVISGWKPKSSSKPTLPVAMSEQLDLHYNPLVCPTCNEHFTKKTQTILHINSAHPKSKPFKCFIKNSTTLLPKPACVWPDDLSLKTTTTQELSDDSSLEHPRSHSDSDHGQVQIGTKVAEGHCNYQLMYDMLTGIRIAVGRVSAKIRRDPTQADFTAAHKLVFDITGNELTPGVKYDFKFKDYAPWVFRHLRERFHIDAADYLMSLTHQYILSELNSPGKSGSFFYYSRDYRFIIKTIRHSEHIFMRKILLDYYNTLRLKRQKTVQYTASPIPLAAIPPTQEHCVFYADNGGFQSSDCNDTNTDLLYFIGVIDFLTPYTLIKKTEHLLKSITQDKYTISSVPPKIYGQRFLEFMGNAVRSYHGHSF